LHRGEAEVGEDGVGAGSLQQRGEAGEIHAVDLQALGRKAECTQAGFRKWQFDGILIETEEFPSGLHSGEQCARVAAIAERAIDDGLAGLHAQHFENFAHHDGAMGAGGRFAGSEDFGESGRIGRRIALFVLFVKMARVRAAITRAARWTGRG
jgi:hypothetical protein